jgi:methionine sulfoxide reductase heme-binding subunit
LKDPAFAKFLVLINSAAPAALLGWDAYSNQLGPDPINSAEHTTGKLTLIFLLLTLSITPARKLTGWNGFSHFRRMLGLFAYFYAGLHFSIYFTFDKSFSVAGVIWDTFHKPFIFIGMLALLALTPLALTSTNGAIKRMGAAKWKQLHRLVYEASIAGVIHFYLTVKKDVRQPLAFAAVLAVLLGYRILAGLVKKKPSVLLVSGGKNDR